MKKHVFAKAALALLMATPMLASAESQLVTGAGAAEAKLNFRVVVPRVLFLGLGTGAGLPLASNTTVDTVIFDYTTNINDVGTGVAASVITGSVVAARVFGNNGQIQIAVTNPANLTSGADTIPFTQITGASSDATNFPLPAFGGAAVSPVLNTTRLTNRTANWTFSYANSVAAASGIYNGQATYTATMP